MRTSALLWIPLAAAILSLGLPYPAGAGILPHQHGPSTNSDRTQETRAAGFDHPQLTYTKLIDGVDVTIRQVGIRPQGDRLAFSASWDSSGVAKREIYLADISGTDAVLISPGNSGLGGTYGYTNPMWSKDGTKLGWIEVHMAAPNRIASYDVQTTICTYIYEPTEPLDAANFDYLGDSNTDIVFWDWNAATEEGDLFTFAGGVRTNITNTPDYSEYEPNSDVTGTRILFWSGEMPAEPCDTTHLLVWNGTAWLKDAGFTPIADSYWAFWAYAGYGAQDSRICLTRYDSGGSCAEPASRDIEIWNRDGLAMVADVTGAYYPGATSWSFFGCNPVHRDGSIYFTSTDDNLSLIHI